MRTAYFIMRKTLIKDKSKDTRGGVTLSPNRCQMLSCDKSTINFINESLIQLLQDLS